MKDWKVLLAFAILIGMVGTLIVLSLNKSSVDREQNKQIYVLSGSIETLSKRLEELKSIKGEDGKTPIKGVDFFDGKNGSDGKDGANGTNGTNGVNGKDGANGEKGEPARDLLIECIDGELSRRYEDDSFWQPMNVKCESVR